MWYRKMPFLSGLKIKRWSKTWEGAWPSSRPLSFLLGCAKTKMTSDFAATVAIKTLPQSYLVLRLQLLIRRSSFYTAISTIDYDIHVVIGKNIKLWRSNEFEEAPPSSICNVDRVVSQSGQWLATTVWKRQVFYDSTDPISHQPLLERTTNALYE